MHVLVSETIWRSIERRGSLEKIKMQCKDHESTEMWNFGLDASVVESLKTEFLNMTAETLTFWLCKFSQEVRDLHRDGKRYTQRKP